MEGQRFRKKQLTSEIVKAIKTSIDVPENMPLACFLII